MTKNGWTSARCSSSIWIYVSLTSSGCIKQPTNGGKYSRCCLDISYIIYRYNEWCICYDQSFSEMQNLSTPKKRCFCPLLILLFVFNDFCTPFLQNDKDEREISKLILEIRQIHFLCKLHNMAEAHIALIWDSKALLQNNNRMGTFWVFYRPELFMGN